MHILVSSRNNYEMFDNFFLKKNQFPNKFIINVDAGSSNTNLEYGQQICKNKNITFLKTKETGLQNVIQETIDYIYQKNNKSKWLLYLHTDAYLPYDNYKKLNKLLNNNFFDKFGLIGFNTIFWPHTKKINDIDIKNKFYFGLMGKSILSENNLSVYGPHTISNRDIQSNWNNLVAIEAVMDIGVLININLFKKFIKVSKKFPFVCAIDDIAMQFLNNNIHNVTLPDIYCVHDPWVKKKYKIPISSPKNLKKTFNNKFYNDDFSFEEEWKIKWKFDRQYKNKLKRPIVNNSIFKKIYTYINNLNRLKKVQLSEEVKQKHKDTLIGDYMNYNKLYPYKIFEEYKNIKN